ncbi:MAG TPA: galactose-1-phosphate uridylyltransferase, partial [Actinomycetota bacterium]|nr:galactose-1-phosphate uridylyltransferase [Actinomycetota bacterium]
MRKTSIRLADGRELIYYDDEHPDADRSMPDRRDPSRIETRSELRRDPLLDEWVAVASHRQDRTYLPPPDECPLDPSTPGRLTEIPAPDYDVVVFENRFPSLALDVDRRAGRARGPAPGQAAPDGTGQAAPDGLVPRRPGIGRCEVVCFTSDHDGALGRLPASRVRTVVDVWADRTVELGAMPGIEQVFPFE